MIIEAIVLVLALAFAAIAWLAMRRGRHYAALRSRLDQSLGAARLDLAPLLERVPPSFEARLARLGGLLPPTALDRVRREALAIVSSERSYIPTHKKGGTVAYETLITSAPSIAALYHSQDLHKLVSRIVGEPVRPTPLHDQSSLSLLFYDRPGDHIGWHYDHNFYRGRHFTVLIPLLNEGSASGGRSHAQLQARLPSGEIDIPTPANDMIVFEGASVLHKVTPIHEGERRMVLSMTFCTDPRANVVQGVMRRLKDVAFYGPRALWT